MCKPRMYATPLRPDAKCLNVLTHLTVHLPSMAFQFSVRSLPFSTIIPTEKWVIPYTDRNQGETAVKSFCLIFNSFSFFLTHSFVWTRKMLGGDFLGPRYDFTEFHTCSFAALQMLNLFLMFPYTRWILKKVETLQKH